MVHSANSAPYFQEPGSTDYFRAQHIPQPSAPILDSSDSTHAQLPVYPSLDDQEAFFNSRPPPYNPDFHFNGFQYAQPLFARGQGFEPYVPPPRYPVASAASAANFLHPPVRRVGSLNGHPLVELTSNGKQYVIYEKNSQSGHLVAMPYNGLHTLRSTQTIASTFLGLLSTGLAAKTALIFKATVLSTSLIAGIAGALIFGIGMVYAWYYNDQDPAAQLEIRTKQLREQTIDLNHFTTPQEKRSFLFNKPYLNINELASDFQSLIRLRLLTEGEIQFYSGTTLPIVHRLNSLEHEYQSKITPHKNAMHNQTSQAYSDYNYSSAVQTDYVIEEAHRQAKLAKARNSQEGYRADDAAIDLAYVGAKQLNASYLKQERAMRDQRISQARQQFASMDAKIKYDINYERRLEEIQEQFNYNLTQFRQDFSNQDLRASDSNVSDLDDTNSLLYSYILPSG